MASNSQDDLAEGCDRAKTRVMVGAALVTGLLVVALAIYGMVAGDRELLAKVCTLIWPTAITTMIWAGGSSVLRALRRIRFDDGAAGVPRSQGR
jgi:hypothetical protein